MSGTTGISDPFGSRNRRERFDIGPPRSTSVLFSASTVAASAVVSDGGRPAAYAARPWSHGTNVLRFGQSVHDVSTDVFTSAIRPLPKSFATTKGMSSLKRAATRPESTGLNANRRVNWGRLRSPLLGSRNAAKTGDSLA